MNRRVVQLLEACRLTYEEKGALFELAVHVATVQAHGLSLASLATVLRIAPARAEKLLESIGPTWDEIAELIAEGRAEMRSRAELGVASRRNRDGDRDAQRDVQRDGQRDAQRHGPPRRSTAKVHRDADRHGQRDVQRDAQRDGERDGERGGSLSGSPSRALPLRTSPSSDGGDGVPSSASQQEIAEGSDAPADASCARLAASLVEDVARAKAAGGRGA